MSTDDQTPQPRTRAEARAAREAAEREGDSARSLSDGQTGVAPRSLSDGQTGVAPRSLSDGGEAGGDETSSAPEADDAAERFVSLRSLNDQEQTAPRSLSDERSEETKRPSSPPKDRRFRYALLAVIGVLAIIVAGLGTISLLQGPRLSQVQVDAAEAIEVSGSRIILTANQPLAKIDPAQITVNPAVPFTVDASGRGIGIRFTVPLDDATEYTVNVADVSGSGGGPASEMRTSFTTPASEIFLLQRSVDGDDSIFRTDLSGEQAVPVFSHPRINDYRATPTNLVVTVEGDDGSKILVMDRDGKNERELTLPGDGFISAVQVSDRGGMVGYSYSDRTLSETSGRASVLVTQSLAGDDEPRIVEVGGEEASIAEWHFVPDSSSVLFIDFDGTLALDDRTADAGIQPLGLAAQIQGISRGTYTAIVERADGTTVELNLADGSETPLAASDPDYGRASTIIPFPGGTLRHVVPRDAAGLPIGQAIIRVDGDGAATPLVEVAAGNAILQACASPSGQYAAVAIAPNMASNEYDDMLVPLPRTLQTHLIDIETGEEMVVLNGFDASWCPMAPSF